MLLEVLIGDLVVVLHHLAWLSPCTIKHREAPCRAGERHSAYANYENHRRCMLRGAVYLPVPQAKCSRRAVLLQPNASSYGLPIYEALLPNLAQLWHCLWPGRVKAWTIGRLI